MNKVAQRVLALLSSGEQTEDYVFGCLCERGLGVIEVDHAIGLLLDAGTIKSSIFEARDYPRSRYYPMLRRA